MLNNQIPMKMKWMGCILLSTFMFNAHWGFASSVSKLFTQGNKAYDEASYEEALSSYEEASVASPEAPEIYFNKGAVYYRQEEYAMAVESFKEAALKSKSITLELQSKYNLGNCAVRMAERQQDNDLKKSLEEYEKAIRHYQDTLTLDPEFKPAAENIEVVRLIMKSILDEIKKQEEEARKQQKQQEQWQERLKQLIEEQDKSTKKSQSLSEEQQLKGNTEDLHNQLQEAASHQSGLKEKTDQLAHELPAPDPEQPSPYESVKKHLEDASIEQGSGAAQLEQKAPRAAKNHQEKATEELMKALESMQGEQDKQKQSQPNQPKEEQSNEAESSASEQPQGEEKNPQEEQPPKESAGPPEQEIDPSNSNARDIIEEEKENKSSESLVFRQPIKKSIRTGNEVLEQSRTTE